MSNPTNRYVTPVGLQQPAAADLSDGTTGSGTVVLSVSPALTSIPTAPTASVGTNTTQIATTAFVLANAGGTTSPVMTEVAQNLTHNGARTLGSTFQNTTGVPIYVSVSVFNSLAAETFTAVSDSSATPTTVVASQITPNATFSAILLQFVVMPNNFYKVNAGATGVSTVQTWREFQLQTGAVTQSADLSGSRSLTTIFQNTSSTQTILVQAVFSATSAAVITTKSDSTSTPAQVVHIFENAGGVTAAVSSFFIVPPLHFYQVTATGTVTISHWWETTWTVACSKSNNLVQTSGAGQTRTWLMSTESIQSVTRNDLPFYVNVTPKVRFVAFTQQNTSTSAYYFWSGDGMPNQISSGLGLNAIGQVAFTAAEPNSFSFPVMPSSLYCIVPISAGTMTNSNWWEYTLG